MKQIKIGVLGGIGPEATAIFYLRLIKKLQDKNIIQTNEDYPQIVINSIPAPELVFDQINKESLKPYINGLKELDSLKLDFIVMVCNTIHLYYDELQANIKTPIINLRKEVFNEINEQNLKTITVIGTPNTLSKGLYTFDGIKYLNPSLKEIDVLSKAIYNFNKGKDIKLQRENSLKIVNKYIKNGSEAAVLGCTEFAAMFDGLNLKKIDTIDVLINAVIKRLK